MVLDYDKSIFFSDTKIEMSKLNEEITSKNQSDQNINKEININYNFLKKINVDDQKINF